VSTEKPSALTCYKASVIQGLPEGVAPGLREQRQRADQQLLDESQLAALRYADEFLLDILTEQAEMDFPVELLRDNPDYPLAHWWWHLGKLRAGTYPVHLLPPYLREIYQPVQPAERLAA